jgi:type IV pilus assembly protein PilM
MKTNFLKKLFYLPNFLSLPVAGIEICNKSIKYIEFSNKKGNISMKNFGEVFLAADTVKDGDILNKASLIKALVEVKGKISSDFVKISIPEEKTYIFDVEMPAEAKSDIREALGFKIEENVPLKLEETSFEYEIINDNKKNSKNINVNVSVIPEKVLSDYADIFDQAEIYPLSFELESKMIVDSVISKNDAGNFIILHIKDDSTIFIAVVGGIARFTSSVAIGESLIRDRLLKTGLFSDELANGKFFENDFSFETTYTKESYDSLINIFSVLKDELEKFNDYAIKKIFDMDLSGSKKIDKIILRGRSATLPGLAKHINQKINADIVLADVWSNVFDKKEVTPNMKFSDSLAFVTTIGLVVSSYKEIDA